MDNLYLFSVLGLVVPYYSVYYMFRLLWLIKTVHKNINLVVNLIGYTMIAMISYYIIRWFFLPHYLRQDCYEFSMMFLIVLSGHLLFLFLDGVKFHMKGLTYHTIVGYKIFKYSFGMIDVYSRHMSTLFSFVDNVSNGKPVSHLDIITTLFSSIGVFTLAGVVFEKMVM